MMFLNSIGKDLTRWQICFDHQGQPQAELSAALQTICHPSKTKYLTCFLPQKQARHAEAIRKENSAEILLVSSLTTAVFLLVFHI